MVLLCSFNLNPFILAIDDKHVSFSLFDNGKDFAIAVVYASTSYLMWKQP